MRWLDNVVDLDFFNIVVVGQCLGYSNKLSTFGEDFAHDMDSLFVCPILFRKFQKYFFSFVYRVVFQIYFLWITFLSQIQQKIDQNQCKFWPFGLFA